MSRTGVVSVCVVFCSVVAASVLLAADQKASYDLRCGSYCLYVSLKALDFPVASFAELESKLGQPSRAGYSLGQLQAVADAYGAHTLGVQTTIENLKRRPGRFACIALIDKAHFINLADVEGGEVSVVDPPKSFKIPAETFCTRWNGKALLISDAPLLAEEDLPQPFPWAIGLSVCSIVGLIVASYWMRRRLMARRTE